MSHICAYFTRIKFYLILLLLVLVVVVVGSVVSALTKKKKEKTEAKQVQNRLGIVCNRRNAQSQTRNAYTYWYLYFAAYNINKQVGDIAAHSQKVTQKQFAILSVGLRLCLSLFASLLSTLSFRVLAEWANGLISAHAHTHRVQLIILSLNRCSGGCYCPPRCFLSAPNVCVQIIIHNYEHDESEPNRMNQKQRFLVRSTPRCCAIYTNHKYEFQITWAKWHFIKHLVFSLQIKKVSQRQHVWLVLVKNESVS